MTEPTAPILRRIWPYRSSSREKILNPGEKLENVSIKDIAPTVAKLLDIAPDQAWEGKNLVWDELLNDGKLVITDKAGARWFAGGRGCIWDRAFCQGIILIFLKAGDAFSAGELSWFDKNVWEGWFPAGELILTWWKALAGMISNSGIDPDSQEMSGRDDFRRGKWSWFAEKVSKGWFLSGRLILICRKYLAGMIPSGEIDPDLREKSHKDDFRRGNSSWFAGNAWQGCILGYGEHSYPKILKSEKLLAIRKQRWYNTIRCSREQDLTRQ